MTARINHKRMSTLRWVCRRVTDPAPWSSDEPEPIAVVIADIKAAIRNDAKRFYVELEVMAHDDTVEYGIADGWFVVYCEADQQGDWPIGDSLFGFSFTSDSATAGQDRDVDQPVSGVIHIQKEEVQWP